MTLWEGNIRLIHDDYMYDDGVDLGGDYDYEEEEDDNDDNDNDYDNDDNDNDHDHDA